jgi:hypothetical protein
MALIGSPEVNHVTGLIIRAAIAVHRALGPGLLESAYQACLVYELRALGLTVEEDIRLPLNYKTVKLEKGYAPFSVSSASSVLSPRLTFHPPGRYTAQQ